MKMRRLPHVKADQSARYLDARVIIPEEEVERLSEAAPGLMKGWSLFRHMGWTVTVTLRDLNTVRKRARALASRGDIESQ